MKNYEHVFGDLGHVNTVVICENVDMRERKQYTNLLEEKMLGQISSLSALLL